VAFGIYAVELQLALAAVIGSYLLLATGPRRVSDLSDVVHCPGTPRSFCGNDDRVSKRLESAGFDMFYVCHS
jgi:hypothetical protein